ncbi:MAG: hypothetical protein Q9192_007085, partial [Flavoplaca navasiana]
AVLSGHSRWSKIKHNKAKVDAKVNKKRSRLSKDIEFASKEGGPNPVTNPRLAGTLAAAKKSGFPKASVEAAIVRGQGRSASGTALEPMVFEVLHSPTGVAAIVDCLTDNKAKLLQETRDKLKYHRAAQAPKLREEDVITEAAVSVGATDIEHTGESASEDSEPGSTVYTESSEMATVAAAVAEGLDGLKPDSMEFVYTPNPETIVAAREDNR